MTTRALAVRLGGVQKQQSLKMAAAEFIAECDLGDYAYRFDIVTVVSPATAHEEVSLFRNAF